MKTGTTCGLSAIVLTLSVLATGCAHLTQKHEPQQVSRKASDDVDDGWSDEPRSLSREVGPASQKKETFFFNAKSREIEKSLGL